MSSLEIQRIVKLINDGNYEYAEELLKTILAKSPQSGTAHYLFGVVLARTGLLEEAEAEFLTLVEKNRRDVEALGALAVIYRRQRKFKDALGVFNEAIDIDPTRSIFYHHIGDIQVLEKNLKAAFMPYAKVIECDPAYAPAYNNLGIVYYESHEFNKAVNVLRQAVALSEGNASLHYNYGTALAAKGALEEAVHEYEAALAIQPIWIAALNNLGIAQAKLGLLDQAGGSFDLILDEDPFNPEAWNNLGVVLFLQGFKAESAHHYRRALEARTEYEIARRNLENLEQETGTEPEFNSAEMILYEDTTISFTALKPEIEPMEGELAGFQFQHLLDFLKYIKEMIAFLPPEVQEAFVRSDARFNMDHIIGMFEGHRGILREIEDWKEQRSEQQEESNMPEPVPEPDRRVPELKTEEITDFLNYLHTLTAHFSDTATAELLAQKMQTIAAAIH